MAIIYLVLPLLTDSSGLPEGTQSEQLSIPIKEKPFCLTLLREGFTLTPINRGSLKETSCITTGAVGSYPAFSPLPVIRLAVCFCGTLRSRKLALATPGRYPAPCSVEFGLSSTLVNRKQVAIAQPASSIDLLPSFI